MNKNRKWENKQLVIDEIVFDWMESEVQSLAKTI